MTKADYFQSRSHFGGLSASVIKIIAAAAMLADHASVIFFGPGTTVLRYIGRIAFPLFAYFIGEGARRTKSKAKYFTRLLAFAFISEIPFDLAFGSGVFDFTSQNVFFTLLTGLISVEALEILRQRHLSFFAVFTTAALAYAALLMKTDYGAMGVILITMLYIFAEKSVPIKLIGSAFSIVLLVFSVQGLSLSKVYMIPSEKWALLAVIPIMLYSGKKGLKIGKYFFYGFYPAHLLLLVLIRLLVKHF